MDASMKCGKNRAMGRYLRKNDGYRLLLNYTAGFADHADIWSEPPAWPKQRYYPQKP